MLNTHKHKYLPNALKGIFQIKELTFSKLPRFDFSTTIFQIKGLTFSKLSRLDFSTTLKLPSSQGTSNSYHMVWFP